MGNFDKQIFLYALYVAFVYSCLAFGATWYRQVVDNIEIRLIHLGEDRRFAYDPFYLVIVAVLIIVFLIFAALALYVWPARILGYVIPLAVLVNSVQIGIRTHFQRMRIKTQGIIGRNLFNGIFEAVAFSDVQWGEIEEDFLWDTVTVYYTPTGEADTLKKFRRRISRPMGRYLVQVLMSATDAKIFMSKRGDSAGPFSSDTS